MEKYQEDSRISTPTHSPAYALFALDTPMAIRLNARECYLRGWFIPSEESQKLVLLVDGLPHPVSMSLPRPDVARAYNKPDAENCGFIAHFDARVEDCVTLVARGPSGDLVLLDSIPTPIAEVLSEAAVRGRQACFRASSYDEWLIAWEPSLFWPRDEVWERIAELPNRPLVSILLPVSQPDRYFLARCLGSVLQQNYGAWELCIADAGAERATTEYLAGAAETDRRIQLLPCAGEGRVSALSNFALAAARGEFVVSLGERDELHPYALLEIVRYLNQHEGAMVIYSDHDQIDLAGKRGHPVFKPAFDSDVLLSFNYVDRLSAFRRSLAADLSGFRPEYEGAHDWDLLIRAMEVIAPDEVQHIPKPLYHRRCPQNIQPGSSNSSLSTHKVATVLSSHIQRTCKAASVEPGLIPGTLRLRQQWKRENRVAIFLRAEDGHFQAAALGRNIDWRYANPYEISGCAVHALHGGTAPDFASPVPGMPLLELGEINGEVLLFINRPVDTVSHLFLEELAGQALRDDCGLVTGLSLDVAGRIEHSGLIRDPSGHLIDPCAGMFFHDMVQLEMFATVRSVEAISGEFFAIRRDRLSAIGGLAALSSARMPQLVQQLASAAHKCGLRVLVTPYAIATFDQRSPQLCFEPMGRDSAVIAANPNLAAFENLMQAK